MNTLGSGESGCDLRRTILVSPHQMLEYVPDLPEERLKASAVVAKEFEFRLPAFYAERVLSGEANDPLLDLVLPTDEELIDGEELWDSTPSCYRASDSPFWIQKYQYQGLLRLTTHCSGLCRFCYLKRKNARKRVMRPTDVDGVFDELERRGDDLRDIILSGGDPLCAPISTLRRVAERVKRLRTMRGTATPFISVHTREPVWNPLGLAKNEQLWATLQALAPKFFMINVVHVREVTPEFLDVCSRLAACAEPARAVLFCQHPVFRGVNDSVEELEALYAALLASFTPILPYYMVHPFYNGTLPKHRLPLERSQAIYRDLVRRPGMFAPKLVVPTPQGKCIVGPFEPIVVENGCYRLVTKDGEIVHLPRSDP